MLWWLLACGNSTETISGVMRLGPGSEAPVLPGVTLTIHDLDFELFDKGESGPDGSYEVTGPRGESIYAEVTGTGLVRTGFVGHVGNDPFEVPDGDIFAFDEAAIDALHDRFAGCNEAGGMVHGEIRLFGAEDSGGNSPLIETGFARLYLDDDVVKEGCYLYDNGVTWNPDAFQTGETGMYAIFGVPPGLHVLEYGYVLGDLPVLHYIDVYVPEDGIAPQFPAWVDLLAF